MLIDAWAQFAGLLPSQTTVVGTVTALNGDGTCTIEFPEGGRLVAQGTVVPPGSKAYVQDRRVLGPAPDLPGFDLTV